MKDLPCLLAVGITFGLVFLQQARRIIWAAVVIGDQIIVPLALRLIRSDQKERVFIHRPEQLHLGWMLQGIEDVRVARLGAGIFARVRNL